MARKFQSFSGLLAIAVIATLASASIAKAEEPKPTTFQPLGQEFNRAFRGAHGDFFQNRSVFKQLGDFFGIVRFRERGITRDARKLNELYRELMEAQFSSTPIIQTPDLPNPYNSSVMTAPLSTTDMPTFGGN